jgi:hypothetical protein
MVMACPLHCAMSGALCDGRSVADLTGIRSWRVLWGWTLLHSAASIRCLHFHLCALVHSCSPQTSTSQWLGLAMNTLPWGAPGGEGDLTPQAQLVYLEMRREYDRVRGD